MDSSSTLSRNQLIVGTTALLLVVLITCLSVVGPSISKIILGTIIIAWGILSFLSCGIGYVYWLFSLSRFGENTGTAKRAALWFEESGRSVAAFIATVFIVSVL